MSDTNDTTKTAEELAAEAEAARQAKIAEIKRQIAELERERTKVDTELTEYTTERDELNNGITEVDDAVATLEASDGAKASYDYIAANVDTYWTIEGSDVAATAKGSMLDSLSELSTDLDTTNGCIGQTITEIKDKVQERLDELEALIEPLEKRLDEIDSELERLRSQLATI